ncbi:MAG: 3'-5' exonuclease [Thermotogota bacterium]|nr:3'-5' exonuclease [Thermotogota bacterium]
MRLTKTKSFESAKTKFELIISDYDFQSIDLSYRDKKFLETLSKNNSNVSDLLLGLSFIARRIEQYYKRRNQMIKQTNEQVEKLQKIIFFDTETSGFLKKDLPADDPDQAWCIQIGAILATEKETLEELNLIIQPAGRSMNPKAEEIHGISLEYADEHGLPELEVTEAFGLMMRKADKIVCHNYDFDWKYVSHMMERNLDNLSDEARSAFYLDLPSQCTMKDKTIVKFCDLKNKAGRPKWPKLIELHQILFGKRFDDAHDAFADISATAKCYFELIRRGIIE